MKQCMSEGAGNGHVTPIGTTTNWIEVTSNEALACEHKLEEASSLKVYKNEP